MLSDDIIITGTVTAKHRAGYEVQTERGSLYCQPRGKLRQKGKRPGVPIAVGDRVLVRLLEEGRGIIDEVCGRETGLDRAAVGQVGVQTLAANVEQALIVLAAAEPRPDWFVLDRFLALAVAADLEPVVCLNKCDLAEPTADLAAYRDAGFRALATSAVTRLGLEELREVLRDRRSVLCGPSGVGKSSLLNALAPGLALAVGETGEVTHKGKHTTTAVRMLELPFGGSVADTPGLRQVGLAGVYPEHLDLVFPDIARLAGRSISSRSCR